MAVSRMSSAVALCAALIAGTAFALWLGSDGPVGDARPMALLMSHIVTPTLVAVLCWLRARRSGRADRIAWLLLGGGVATWGAGSVVFLAYILIQGEPPYPSYADLLYLLFVVPTLAALVYFSASAPHAVSRLHTIIDGLVIGASLLLLSWRTLLGDVVQAPGERGLAWMVTIAYPIADVSIAAVVASLAWRHGRGRLSMSLLCGGLFLVAISDTFYVREGFYGELVPGQGFWQAGYTVGFLLVGVAALSFPSRSDSGAAASRSTSDAQPRQGGQLEWSAIAGQVFVFVIVVMAVAVTVTVPDWSNDRVLVGLTVATVGLLGLNRVLLIAEAAVLRADLEDKVLARTRELDASRTRLLSVTQTATDAIVVIDSEGVIQAWNAGADELFGTTADEAAGRRMAEFMPERFREAHEAGLARLRNGGEAKPLRNVMLSALRADGAQVPVELSISGWEHDGARYFTGILRDISSRRRAEDIQHRERMHMQLVQQVALTANQTGDVTRAVRVSLKHVAHTLGWPVGHAFLVEDEGDATPLTTVAWHVADRERFGPFVAASEGIQFTRENGVAGAAMAKGEPVWIHTADPAVALLRKDAADRAGIKTFLAFPIRSQDRLVGVMEFFATEEIEPAADELRLLDVVGTQIGRVIEREQTRRRLTRLALHDPLTGLANRVVFNDRLKEYLAQAAEDGRTVGALLVDLDGFKEVNDSLGHAAGDELLVEVARRLEQATRRTDTVARLGGDEFAIAVRNVAADGDIDVQVARILDTLSEPIDVHGRRIRPMGSIGVALSDGVESAETLLRNADLAMYDAKAAGKGRVSFYDPEMYEVVHERMDLESSFDHAIERGDLTLLYRPVVSLRTGRVVAREALLRWLHPERGLMDPAQLVRSASSSQLAARVTAWTLAQACKDAAAWRAAGETDVRLALNIAWRDLVPTMIDEVKGLLSAHDLPPSSVEVQVVALANGKVSNEAAPLVVAALVGLGIRVSLDEFGTGNASFDLIRDLHVDQLRVGGHLVAGLPADLTSCALVDAMVSMGLALDVDVVAVGVETREQLDLLRARGCAAAQGPLIGEPQPFHERLTGPVPAAWLPGSL